MGSRQKVHWESCDGKEGVQGAVARYIFNPSWAIDVSTAPASGNNGQTNPLLHGTALEVIPDHNFARGRYNGEGLRPRKDTKRHPCG